MGCIPFADIPRYETVMLKVMKGDRPDKPPSGLSDTLWELLVATWVAQRAQESGGRPPASTILDQLKECVDDWGESIVPLVPKSWQEVGECRMSLNKSHCLFMSLSPR